MSQSKSNCFNELPGDVKHLKNALTALVTIDSFLLQFSSAINTRVENGPVCGEKGERAKLKKMCKEDVHWRRFADGMISCLMVAH